MKPRVAKVQKLRAVPVRKAAPRRIPKNAIGPYALEVLLRDGQIKPTDRILIFNTGASQKYPEAVHEKLPHIDITRPLDWNTI